MAKRDMRETAKRVSFGAIPGGYELTVAEIIDLFREATRDKEGTYNSLTTAFLYGYVLGHRATKAGKYREVKA